MKARLTLALLMAMSASAGAQEHGAHNASKYAGEELRSIKSLSEDDIQELRKGAGWGLAKAAELNGVPGPAHLLELKNELALTPAQVSAIEAIHARMKADAIAEGERLIALEKELEDQFRSGAVTNRSLRDMLGKIEQSRSALRHIHLATHLQTPALLTPEQIVRYKSLRGYEEEPCGKVPDGHDAAMWRKHNGCD